LAEVVAEIQLLRHRPNGQKRYSELLPKRFPAVAAREKLEAEGIKTRVVSAPCVEWFDEQSESYRESVLPKNVSARVSVEAGLCLGWSKYVGGFGESVSIEHFGASADYKTLFREFGMTTEAVVAAAHKSLENK
jgi:transketolase